MNNEYIVDTDKAYILGLILGGGEIQNSRLIITLPYRNWGSLKINPQRSGEISQYIINTLKPIWHNTYGVDLSYSVDSRMWQIHCEINEKIVTDLRRLGFSTAGVIKESADIGVLSKALNNDEKTKRFVAGLTDTIGSLAKSHRHRVDSRQIISFEFSGKNFKLIADLVDVFNRINCFPDQILWNHPNFHSSKNRYYSTWRKGFKFRVKLQDYMVNGNFVSNAKKLSAEENAQLINSPQINELSYLSLNGRSCLHMDESSDWLPKNIRGLHFIHFTHLLYVLGGTISRDTISFLSEKLEEPEKLFSPFTILTKGTRNEIMGIIRSEEYLRKTTYKKMNSSLGQLIYQLSTTTSEKMFGKDEHRGFPKNEIIHAITYIALSEIDSSKLKGNRVLGKFEQEFEKYRNIIPSLNIEVLIPDRGTCLLIRSKDKAALIGYQDDVFNKSLVSVEKSTLKMSIKNPIFEECVIL